jgi:[protein-PII] uridylyltransferase
VKHGFVHDRSAVHTMPTSPSLALAKASAAHTMPTNNPAIVKAFAESMPSNYRSVFDWPAISEHASIARRRRSGQPSVGRCYAPRLPGHPLCIVADDQPGLLATISAALTGERLDVIAAEAYTRRVSESQREAVDVFWVRRLDAPHEERALPLEVLERLETKIAQLLLEHFDPHNARLPTQPPPALAAFKETSVKFLEDRNGMLSTLVVEASDRTGMLLVLTRALFEQHVQIVSSVVRTENGRAKDRFEITELDDTPIRPERRLLVQVAVLSAIQQSFGA